MNPATIIRESQADGVRLALSPAGTIKATGDGAAVNRWLAVIRERKAEIIEALKVDAGRTAHLTTEDESAIRAWLGLIEETDPATIAEVINQCQRDADARDYFTRRAVAELPKPDPFPADPTPEWCVKQRRRQ